VNFITKLMVLLIANVMRALQHSTLDVEQSTHDYMLLAERPEPFAFGELPLDIIIV
jgi:hypothetical protein